MSLDQVIAETQMLAEGGTLEVMLGVHALRRGYRATLQTFNLRVLDPTWFAKRTRIEDKLQAQIAAHRDPKLEVVTRAYLEFLRLGGRLRFEDMTSSVLRRPLRRGLPVLTGLSATFLYRSMRELPGTNLDDDIRGEPVGHFVVLCGYDKAERSVLVADPLEANPYADERKYSLPISRVVGSIFLGVLTYDASFLVIEPAGGRVPPEKKP